MENSSKSWWDRTKELFTDQAFVNQSSAIQTYSSPGSVMSAGGNSPLPGIVPPPPNALPVLDARTAMGIGAVAAAHRILTSGLSQLPIDVIKAGQEIDRPSIVKQPDVRMTQRQFKALLMDNLIRYGNAYVRKHESVTQPGITASMEILNPEFVVIENRKGRPVYHYGDTEFADWQVHHCMVNVGFDPGTNVVRGFSFIELNRAELQAMLDLRDYAANWFRNTGNVPVVLKTDQDLGDGGADRIKAAYYASRRNGDVLVLDNNFSIEFMQLDPEKAQFSALSNKSVTDVARMAGIPANLMLAEVDGTSTTYSNVQDNEKTFVLHTLTMYAQAIEELFTSVLPRGQEAKFNYGALLRGDVKSRYDAHKIALDAKFLTVNEVREIEDLPPLDGGSNSTEEATQTTNE